MHSISQFIHDPRTVDEDTSLTEAARCMERWHVGALVVTRGDEAVGMVTDRDLMLHGILTADCGVTVRECMSVPLIAVSETVSVHQAVETMRINGVRRLGVRGASGELIGVVSADEIWSEIGTAMGHLAKAIQKEFAAEKEPSSLRKTRLSQE